MVYELAVNSAACFIAAVRHAAEQLGLVTGSDNITAVPEHILALTHPGLYMQETGIQSNAQFLFRLLYHYATSASNLGEHSSLALDIEKQTYQKSAQCFEVDQRYLEGKPVDRTFHDKAWLWVSQSILKPDSKKLQDYSRSELSTMITTLHEKLSGPKSIYGFFSAMVAPPTLQSKLRTSQIIVWQDQNLQTDPVRFTENTEYFETKKPEDLRNYKEFYNAFYYAYAASAECKENTTFYDIAVKISKSGNQYARAFVKKYIGLPANMNNLSNEMTKFLDALPGHIKQDPIKAAVYAHCKIAELHPFNDGNGRLARMVMNCILKQNGYKAICFLRNTAYMEATHHAIQQNNYGIFETFLRKQIKQQNKSAQKFITLSKKMDECKTECQETLDKQITELKL